MGSSRDFHEVLIAQITIQLYTNPENVVLHRHTPNDLAVHLDRTHVFTAFEEERDILPLVQAGLEDQQQARFGQVGNSLSDVLPEVEFALVADYLDLAARPAPHESSAILRLRRTGFFGSGFFGHGSALWSAGRFARKAPSRRRSWFVVRRSQKGVAFVIRHFGC